MDNVRIYNLERLRAAVQKGIDDSEAGRFTTFNSADALSAHLSALRATAKPDLAQVLLNAPRGEPLDLRRDPPDDVRAIAMREVSFTRPWFDVEHGAKLYQIDDGPLQESEIG
jgi:hypothetical protein